MNSEIHNLKNMQPQLRKSSCFRITEEKKPLCWWREKSFKTMTHRLQVPHLYKTQYWKPEKPRSFRETNFYWYTDTIKHVTQYKSFSPNLKLDLPPPLSQFSIKETVVAGESFLWGWQVVCYVHLPFFSFFPSWWCTLFCWMNSKCCVLLSLTYSISPKSL